MKRSRQKLVWLRVGQRVVEVDGEVYKHCVVQKQALWSRLSAFAIVRQSGNQEFRVGPHLFDQMLRDADDKIVWFTTPNLQWLVRLCEQVDQDQDLKHRYTQSYGIVRARFSPACASARSSELSIRLDLTDIKVVTDCSNRKV